MKIKMGKRVICFLLSLMLTFGLLPTNVFAVTEHSFVLVVESQGKLVIAPEYVTYTEGQTIIEALLYSGHEFLGLEEGIVYEIDGQGGNYTRSDEFGDYTLTKQASEIKYYRFSEVVDGSQPNEGLQKLMTAMAEYQLKDEDVKEAAKEAYDTAYTQFVGLDSDTAKVFADDLNKAMTDYESTQNGAKYKVTFTDGNKAYSGVSITAKNAYGKQWTDDGDGVLELPVGSYAFAIREDGQHVEGKIDVTADMTVKAALPEDLWLKLDAFRLSGSYGAEDNEENKFSDGEFTMGTWKGRKVTVPVNDTFTGTVYSYVEYDTSKLSEVPDLKAVYTPAKSDAQTEQKIPFKSLTSGATNVLKRGSVGNTVIYRVSKVGADGYTYSQDYTVTLERVPTLAGISVVDKKKVDQVATVPFDANVTEYTYKVLDTVTEVMITPTPLDRSYDVTVNGQNAANGVKVAIAHGQDTNVEVKVSAHGYTNTYTLNICPGEGKALSFVTSDSTVTVEVVNKNGQVIPYEKLREGTQNRYKYALVPGETYSYVATAGQYYHIADEFTMEDAADTTIQVTVPKEDWLSELSFGSKKTSASKNSLALDSTFKASDHSYKINYIDTEHLAYIWVKGDADADIQVLYDQIYSAEIYHGKNYAIELISGAKTGEQLKRFLMDENPYGNTATVRLTKESDGVTYYQDYVVEFARTLTLEDIATKCDGISVMIKQPDGTLDFAASVYEYSVTVSMAASMLELALTRYTDNPCYGEENVGYRVKVDGTDVTNQKVIEIPLDGTINTQTLTITVENDKAPNGTTEYILHILKSPPVEAVFEIEPEDALLTLHETMSGERLWADEEGAYQLCEGYSYKYALTQFGYIGKTGILEVARDEAEQLVVKDGEETYVVTESAEGGGAVTIHWPLEKAPVNPSIDSDIYADWPDFRGNDANNAVTNDPIPTVADQGTLYWANQLGEGFDSDAVGSPIVVNGDIITYAGSTIFRVDTMTGEVLATGEMDHKSSFAITPPAYSEGMVFVALSNGTVQAFNALTLESLWVFGDPLGGQPNCPLTIRNGYLYTGFWNSETGDANFVCLSVTDEDPAQKKEAKAASWYYTEAGGYYWAGALVTDEYVLVGTDDGTNKGTSQTSSLLLLEPKTGELIDTLDGLNGDVRSTVVYDETTDAYYFTSKGGSFYCVKVNKTEDGYEIAGQWSIAFKNGTGGTPMSTCSPVVHNGRAYVGVSGSAQFGSYSGHNITVIDLASKSIAYSVETQGYPQTSGLLTTAYEEESGYVYVYFFDNMTPGKLRVVRDKAGQTKADYFTTEAGRNIAYTVFTPTGDQAQYAICSPIVDEYGTIYFKNDTAYLMAFGSAIEKIEVTTKPKKMYYQEGETFDPTGMVVTATYVNGKTRDITKYVSYAVEPVTENNKIVTISFEHVMYHNEEDGTSMKTGVATTTPYTTLELKIGEEEKPVVVLGDVNMDGVIDSSDGNLIGDYYNEIIELDEQQLALADVNGDGTVDMKDANLVNGYVNKAIEAFPAGN